MKTRFFQTPEGRVGVVVDQGSREKILHRHFRGRARNKAGNFALWGHLAGLLDDPRFEAQILPALLAAREEIHRPTVSVEVEFDEFVGWTAATDYDDLAWLCRHTDLVEDEWGNIFEGEVADIDPQVMPQTFEWRRLRRGVKAEFVTDGSPAPMTRTVTVIARLFPRDWGTLIVLYSIRPGTVMPDFMVGRHGDIKIDEEYQLMFWDWECEGDDPADPVYPYGRHIDDPRRHLLTDELIHEDLDDEYFRNIDASAYRDDNLAWPDIEDLDD